MNPLAHFLFNYLAFTLLFPDMDASIITIFIFAVILDLDHIPGMFKKTKAKTTEQLARRYRTFIQEPVGIIVLSVILINIYLLSPDSILLIAVMSFVLHWLLDFLTVHTMPFNPFNKNVFCLFFNTKKQRIYSEVIITAVLILCFFCV